MQVEQVRTHWGPMYVFANDTGVSRALKLFGEYALPEIQAYRRLLEPGDAFVDVGANIGAVARGVAAAPSRPAVIGFEPQPEFHRLACANLLAEDRATMYPLGVSDRAGVIEIDEVDPDWIDNYGGRELREDRSSDRRVPCPMVRLDAFLPPRAPAPRLVKIDVEGMEVPVLRGLRGLLHDRMVVSVEAEKRETLPAILDELRGFRVFAVFFRMISGANPRFDHAIPLCRVRHKQLLAFAGDLPDWLPEPGYWPIRTADDFDQIAAKYFGAADPSAGGQSRI